MKIDKYFHLYGKKDEVVFEEVNLDSLGMEKTAKVRVIDFNDIDLYKCRACQYYVDKSFTYCPNCGSRLIWGDDDE